ncbi:MAG: hypothetical protein WKG52_00830 [Variovorax sp.]
MNDTNRPTVEERYSSAINTSNMKVVLDRPNVADVIIAAGWSRAKFGTALMRLQSEWDGSEKPRSLAPAAVKVLANVFTREGVRDGKVVFKDAKSVVHLLPPAEAAKRQAHEWHMHELGVLFQKLKTLSEVRALMAEYAWLRNFQDPHTKAAAVISWWLHHTCTVCGGGKWEVIPGTNRHSNRACSSCKGSGDAQIPYEWEGRRMLSEIEKSLNQARCSMGAATSNKSREAP